MRRLEISGQAIDQLDRILDYLASEFQYEVVLRLEEHWLSFRSIVVNHPLQYPFYETKNGRRLHKAVIQSLTIILFWFDEDKVQIEAVYDARSDWQSQV